MSLSTLPKELVSLIHHVELNKSGWWDSANEHLVLYAIWVSNPCTKKELHHNLRQIGSRINSSRLDEVLTGMIASGRVNVLPDTKIKLSESLASEFEKKIDNGEQIEKIAKNIFQATIDLKCPGIDIEATWKLFNEMFLIPYIKEVGANAFHFVLGKTIDVDSRNFVDFLGRYNESIRGQLREGIDLFFKSENPAVKDFVLRSINAYFFIEASGLSSQTISALAKLRENKPEFNIYLDTNYVFSVLGIHENPANDAALSLIKLIVDLKDTIHINLYVLPTTIDEARRTLNAAKDNLKEFRPARNVITAALDMGVSGLIHTYLEEAKVSQISPEDYFVNRYSTNLIKLLSDKDIKMVEENVDQFKVDTQVLSDHHSQLTFQQTKPPSRRKSYESWMHDIVLWHYVKTKRPQRLDSPTDAKAWIVTLDRALLDWDVYKSTRASVNVQQCVHPTSLLQMLQFWLPRNEEFEKAMMNTLRLPFLYYEYDDNAEKITVRIMNKISQYESIENLPEKSVLAIIENEAVRQKISQNEQPQTITLTIREVLVGELDTKEKDLKNLGVKTEFFGRGGY